MTAVVLRGDARRLPLPDASVDLIVTSPPYFGLRSYTDTCRICLDIRQNGLEPAATIVDYDAHVRRSHHYDGQIGSEASPAEWVAALVACTAEWVRVLKPSGSLFVNLGDKYAAGHGGSSTEGNGVNLTVRRDRPAAEHWAGADSHPSSSRAVVIPGTRPKSLLGLPWRYALACMDELGLILRRDIIWEKVNGLPESVADRCRSSHEYIFHFTRQPRYYSAVDEIRSPANSPGRAAGTALSRPALGPELRATIRTEDGPAVTRGWCQLGSLQQGISAAVTRQAQGLQVLRPVGFRMRIEAAERDYVIDLDAVRGPALDAATAVAFEDALAKLSPAGSAPRLVAAPPAGVVLADVILDDTSGRAEVLDLECVPVAAKGLAARLTLDLHPGRATILVWTALRSSHASILPQRNTPLGKLPGSVWAIPSQPLLVPESLGISHFAAYPMELPRRVILGWSPPGVCTGCGEGRRPVSDVSRQVDRYHARPNLGTTYTARRAAQGRADDGGASGLHMQASRTITGYACACPDDSAPVRPAVVVDPFCGTGTTMLVASALGRIGIGVDRSMDYARLARWRTADPGEIAKAMQVPKPPARPEGQATLFDDMEAS